MQPCLLTREKYTFHREIKLQLPHRCTPSDTLSRPASAPSQHREGRREREMENKLRQKFIRSLKGNYFISTAQNAEQKIRVK